MEKEAKKTWGSFTFKMDVAKSPKGPLSKIQKNLAEADGSRDNLPPPADAPEQFGLGIKREEPKHY